MTKQERIDREQELQLQRDSIEATHRLAAAMERIANASEAQAVVANPTFAASLLNQTEVVSK